MSLSHHRVGFGTRKHDSKPVSCSPPALYDSPPYSVTLHAIVRESLRRRDPSLYFVASMVAFLRFFVCGSVRIGGVLKNFLQYCTLYVDSSRDTYVCHMPQNSVELVFSRFLILSLSSISSYGGITRFPLQYCILCCG